jgi:hypothetical protein
MEHSAVSSLELIRGVLWICGDELSRAQASELRQTGDAMLHQPYGSRQQACVEEAWDNA